MNKRIVFGMDGWSAAVGEDFTEENVIRIAEALGEYLTSNNANQLQVAIGFDGRKDSRAFAGVVANLLAAKDLKVMLSAAVVPTPVLSFATKQLGCVAGIMVTGGNRPSQYNGLKFRRGNGGPFEEKETKLVESLIKEGTIEHLEGSDLISVVDFLPAYLSNLKTIVDFSALRSFAENPKKVASVLIDSMGGAGQDILEDILVDCHWRAQTLFGEPAPDFFSRSPEVVSENLDPLKYNVSVTDTAFGIATDGDGGRCGIVYDNGDWMNPENTALTLLWHLLAQKGWKGSVVTTAHLIGPLRVLTGRWDTAVFEAGSDFSSIANMMMKKRSIFSSDERGGFAYGKNAPDNDGILTGLLFAEMIAMSGKSIREIVHDIRRGTIAP